MTTPRPTPPTLLYLMKQVELAVRSRLDDLVRPVGLTAVQYTTLTVLERHCDLSSAELARYSFVTAQSTADMVTALQASGLVERHRDAADRRRLVLALTPAGRRVLRRYRPKVAALESAMLAGLSTGEVTELRRCLLLCRSALDDQAPGRHPPGAVAEQSGNLQVRSRMCQGGRAAAKDGRPEWTRR